MEDRTVKGLAQDPANGRVEISVEPVYYDGNVTTRPDAFNASYRVNGGDWVTTIFRNKPEADSKMEMIELQNKFAALVRIVQQLRRKSLLD